MRYHVTSSSPDMKTTRLGVHMQDSHATGQPPASQDVCVLEVYLDGSWMAYKNAWYIRFPDIIKTLDGNERLLEKLSAGKVLNLYIGSYKWDS